VVALAAFEMSLNFADGTRLDLALALVAVAALALRRRFPLLVFLFTLPATLNQEILVPAIAALYTLGERSCNRRTLAVCATLAAVAVVIAASREEGVLHDRTWTLLYFVDTLAAATAPVLFGQFLKTRRDLSQRLEEIEEGKEHERALHAQAVLAGERTQLAREMHDVVSHQVSLIAVQAGALQVSAKEADSRAAARSMRALSVGTLDELRTMVRLLRASGGDPTELAPQPTLADSPRLVASSSIEAELTGGDLLPTVGTPAQRAPYRAVQ
jgi:signal transduction histidine kinase